jgi:gas vesicle protein
MKPKSILLLLTGIAIGAIAGVLFSPQKTIKKKKGPVKKVNKSKKALKEAASKYKKELHDMEEDTKRNG